MNGRTKHNRVFHSVDYGYMTHMDRIVALEKENNELSEEIHDMRTSLELNKTSLVDILTATTSESKHKALVVTINRLVAENLKLQQEVQRVQDEFKNTIKNSLYESSKEVNPEEAPEESKKVYMYHMSQPKNSQTSVNKPIKSVSSDSSSSSSSDSSTTNQYSTK